MLIKMYYYFGNLLMVVFSSTDATIWMSSSCSSSFLTKLFDQAIDL